MLQWPWQLKNGEAPQSGERGGGLIRTDRKILPHPRPHSVMLIEKAFRSTKLIDPALRYFLCIGKDRGPASDYPPSLQDERRWVSTSALRLLSSESRVC